ncbi:putative membrane protein YpjA [Bacillus iocasae]|uniref:Membrane protein YpjA n=1 Tax=Priestia iocasae TaxID=2291674 RepID=A0ABS2QS05_9BACI|nr:putative membrane protein YpjA [Metabacillus iocasae]
MNWLLYVLKDRRFLWLLLIVNVLGTIYGYIWYGNQLAQTPGKFLLFVPDSPTASLFFVIVLIGFLLKRNFSLFEALATVTLFKYGVWAVVMNLLVYKVTGVMDPVMLMLVASHAAMAIQGILYAPFYTIKMWHLVVAAIWTLHNDIIDYVFFMMPRYRALDEFIPQIGYFTFWLSILSIAITYFFCKWRQKK